MIRSSSTFFDKALAGPWTEASQRLVKLTEEERSKLGISIDSQLTVFVIILFFILSLANLSD